MKHADFLILIGGRCDRKWRFSNRETAFGGVQKILNGEIFMNFIGGRCDRKWRFSKRETAFAGVQNFVRGDVDENRHFIEGKVVAHGQFRVRVNLGCYSNEKCRFSIWEIINVNEII